MSAAAASRPAGHLDSIEITRGVTCVMVVLFHSINSIARERGIPIEGLPLRVMYLAASTVDLFYVISGFLMVYISADVMGRPGAAGDFAVRRAIRILPVYWILTALYAGYRLTIKSVREDPSTPSFLAASMLLWPSWHPDGFPKVSPVLPQGWTLYFEVYFYALFALFAWRGSLRALTVGLPLVLAAVVLAAQGLPEGGPRAMLINPIVFDFWFGVLLGGLYRTGWRPTPGLRAALLATSLAILFACSPWAHFSAWRPLAWGVPAAMFLAALLHLRAGDGLAARAGQLSGQVSYSLYLSHLMLIEPAARAVRKGHLEAVPSAVLVGSLFVLSLSVGVGLYYTLERPLLRWLTAAWRRHRLSASPASPPSASGG